MVDRVALMPKYRGQRLVRTIVERIIALLRLNRESTLVVLQPEPQQESGGPYPYGAVRDAALAKLREAHNATGFQQWRDSDVWWLQDGLTSGSRDETDLGDEASRTFPAQSTATDPN